MNQITIATKDGKTYKTITNEINLADLDKLIAIAQSRKETRQAELIDIENELLELKKLKKDV